jgi:biopolymer transport protein ExbD
MFNKSQEQETDFELNITPIVDCFTVLITFLLMSASAIALGVYQVGLTSTAPEDKKIQVSNDTLKADDDEFKVEVNMLGKGQVKMRLPKDMGTVSLSAGAQKTLGQSVLTALKEKASAAPKDKVRIVVNGKKDIQYLEVLGIIEEVRTEFPGIYIGEVLGEGGAS